MAIGKIKTAIDGTDSLMKFLRKNFPKDNGVSKIGFNAKDNSS